MVRKRAGYSGLAMSLLALRGNAQQPNTCFRKGIGLRPTNGPSELTANLDTNSNRWSGQMAIANAAGATSGNGTSTLYYYGGEAITSQGATAAWTNALVSIDLTKSWNAGTPPLSLVTADTGNQISPPAVARASLPIIPAEIQADPIKHFTVGALWASENGDQLYLYGGEFSDSPNVNPPAQQVWSYSLNNASWGVTGTTGDSITRAAEGSSALVASGGTGDNMGYYFSGHEDDHTTQGWSNQIARIYLSSMVTFDLGSHAVKNISSYSATSQTSNTSTPESSVLYRADGTLTYVPGLGTNGKGILVAVGGATATQYIDNSVLDVYDIGSAGWTKQATLGDTIGSRINHCAVRASAKVHGVEQHQIFIYGGQQLNQSARDSAMYILTLPSYTWTFVGDELSGQPAGRAGHQCALQGSQLIVVGGVVSTSIICDQPGVYVYDVSKSAWQNSYTAGTTYSTPTIVANITGGIGTGMSSSGAGSAAGGDGSQDADTSGSTSGSSSNNGTGSTPGTTISGGGASGGSSSSSKKKSNAGAIAGGVVGGLVLLALLALLFFLLARRRRRQRQVASNEKAGAGLMVDGAPARSNSGSSGSAVGFPYEKAKTNGGTPSTNSPYGWRASGSIDARSHDSDDVEESTRGMEAAFGGSHLVPRAQLVVRNPDEAG